MLAIVVVIGCSLLVGTAIRQQIWEKESHNAMILNVMGLDSSVIWIIWMLMTFLSLFVVSGLLTLLMTQLELLKYSNPLLVFLLLLTTSTATLAFW